MKRFEYYQPESVKEALGLMERLGGRARYVAGGTDLIVRMKQKVLQPEALISLRGVAELKGLEEDGELSLGGMTLIREIERSPLFRESYPALAQAAHRLANPQVRNVATLGGNLVNGAPSADGAPPLMVLGASVTLEGPGGERRVDLGDFFKGPGETCMDPSEILKAIHIPKTENHAGMAFLKIGRTAQDIAIVNAAALLQMEGRVCRRCRIAVGAVAPVPLRLADIEERIEGEEIGPELLESVAKWVEGAVSPISDVRSTEAYRREMSGVLVKRAIREAMGNASAGRGEAESAASPVDGTLAGFPGPSGLRREERVPPDAPSRKVIHFTLNGHEVACEAASHRMLHEVLREEFHLTGTKEGCGQGECGACTVLVDGRNVDACLWPIYESEGRSITTIEGLLGEGNRLHPIQEAFIEKGGVQCGFCTPGMVMSAKALLDEAPNPEEADIREAISGNLCRCTGYIQIIESIQAAAESLSGSEL